MGAHDAPLVWVPSFNHAPMAFIIRRPVLLIIMITLFFFVASTSSQSDSGILLKFKGSLGNPKALDNWNAQTPTCNGATANWDGVLCDKSGNVWGLQMENMGLTGTIDVNILQEMKELRAISFMKNNFEGPLPDLKKIGNVKTVYLSDNKFSGVIPADAFDGMSSLKKLYLANNQFTGPIPSSLASLNKLLELGLEGNKFDGMIPDFESKELQMANFSNNNLVGPLPPGLLKLDPSSFSGNKGLCGGPLARCGAETTEATTPSEDSSGNPSPNNNGSPSDSTSSTAGDDGGSSTMTIVIVSVVSALALAAIIVAFLVLRKRNNQESDSLEAPAPSNLQKKSGMKPATRDLDQRSEGSAQGGGKKAEASTKLSFVRDDRGRFDLHDLLKASAEILGSGCFGSSYKTALTTGAKMVVKRFKQMNNVNKEEFQEHMRRIGRLRHTNLLPLVAYYYRKEEKLLVTDYIEKGSLAVHLHGYQALGIPSLDWPNRLKIVKGVARGLTYLYKELPSLVAPHGHIKSSNVLLDENFEPLLSDYGLIPVINQESAQELMVAYKSPEYAQHGRITKKTDVWGLGMLILEVLTGKFPANFLQTGKKTDEDLANWTRAAIEGDNTSEVFDKDLGGGTRSCEGEMFKLLKIGLMCCEDEVEKRLDLKEAVERIEEIKEKDGEDDFFSSAASDIDSRSTRGRSDDFNFS